MRHAPRLPDRGTREDDPGGSPTPWFVQSRGPPAVPPELLTRRLRPARGAAARRVPVEDRPRQAAGEQRRQSSRRPSQASATQQMEVQVKNRLSRFLEAVGDEAEAPILESLLPGDLDSRSLELPQQKRLILTCVQQRRYVLSGNNQDMCRSLGVYVVKGDQFVVLIDNLGRNLAACDLAEEAVAHTRPSSALLGRDGLSCADLAALRESVAPPAPRGAAISIPYPRSLGRDDRCDRRSSRLQQPWPPAPSRRKPAGR